MNLSCPIYGGIKSKMDKIDTWIENRFGAKNTFNRQLLDNFIEFLEKELGYVRKADDQSLPKPPLDIRLNAWRRRESYKLAQQDMLLEHWVKVKE